MLNRAVFFDQVRLQPFRGKLSLEQVKGIEAILGAWQKAGSADLRWLAYILATVFHETARRMVPVREGLSKTDDGARRAVAKYKYGKADPDTGHVYYGRGHIQITWRANYERAGKLYGLDLVANPDLALQLDISARIAVEGMIGGLFTGKRLDDYFRPGIDDPIGARRIINGRDKADLIAGYHARFLAALSAAVAAPADAKPEPKKPTITNSRVKQVAAAEITTAAAAPFVLPAVAAKAGAVALAIAPALPVVDSVATTAENNPHGFAVVFCILCLAMVCFGIFYWWRRTHDFKKATQ